MRSWNVHSWYVTGILSVLLIGTVSVQWNNVSRLPEIISFAVGLASLILSVFAIIQSITAGGDANATLAAVREAAGDLRNASGKLVSEIGEIRKATGDVLSSSEAQRMALEELNEKMAKEGPEKLSNTAPTGKTDFELGTLTAGGSAAYYAAIRSFETKKPFSLDELFPNDSNTEYESGFLSSLRATKHIEYEKTNDNISVESIRDQNISGLKGFLKKSFKSEWFKNRIKVIDEFFN